MEGPIDELYTKLGFIKDISLEEKKIIIQNIRDSEQKEYDDAIQYMQTIEYKDTVQKLKIETMTLQELQKQFEYNYNLIEFYDRITPYSPEYQKMFIVKRHLEHEQTKQWVDKYWCPNEWTPGTDYIGFFIENGCFACRDILVPKVEFEKAYPTILPMLQQNTKLRSLDEHNCVNHYLTIQYHRDSEHPHLTTMEQTPVSYFAQGMKQYVDLYHSPPFSRYGYGVLLQDELWEDIEEQNRPWYVKSICEGARFFDVDSGSSALNKWAIENNCQVVETYTFRDHRP